jgi:large subunit ribosomal protein L7Ae
VPTKAGIGQSLGISVGSSAAAIEEAGEAENLVSEIITKVNELVK